MKKICLFACTLLLLSLFHAHAAPTPANGNFKFPTANSNVIIPVQAIKPDGTVLTVYARLGYENEYNSGYGLYGDVVARFYEDPGGEIPLYVYDLQVNYSVIGYDGYSNYSYTSYSIATGYYVTIASNQEHDYDDGETFRYKDFHIEPGNYNW